MIFVCFFVITVKLLVLLIKLSDRLEFLVVRSDSFGVSGAFVASKPPRP